jgi:exodeoxyribonuclease VII large subunit
MHLLKQRIGAAMRRQILLSVHQNQQASSALRNVRPDTSSKRNRLDQLSLRLRSAITVEVQRNRHQLQHLGQGLDHLNPAHTVARGFAIVRNAKGVIVNSPLSLPIDEVLAIELAHGNLHAKRIPDHN